MRRSFTLIELIVAIAIIAISATMAAAYLRSESPARRLENGSREFEAFCSSVRFRACEEGEEWKVCYEPDTRTFVAFKAREEKLKLPDSEDEESGLDEVEEAEQLHYEKVNSRVTGEGEEEKNAVPMMPVLRWKLPEKLEFSTENQSEDDLMISERLEIFRFYADGMGGGGNRLIFSTGELQQTFSVSKLTGQLLSFEGSPEDVDERLASDEPDDGEENL
ncbi:MAG: prepilin-type N-terminal cleavage/methylation domain-containing protein [Lentisphaeria bacterium]|nr:prepilin-type N-terminal cleavage/methylation domain-containing protein [Lentisphaeria bacterium]